MKRLLACSAVAAALTGCGGDDEPQRASAEARSPAPLATAVPEIDAELGRPTRVPGTANIYGAGRERPPSPGGGGGGVLPPRWFIPGAGEKVVTFPRIAGQVSPINPSEPNGAAGDRLGPTDVSTYRGISGIVHRRNGMFLVGVFLPDFELLDHAPPRLDFTRRERFRTLAPRIGQTFLIGDGKRRSYKVPGGASRLYVGFADGYLYVGDPGWYDNNGGRLSVTVELRKLRHK